LASARRPPAGAADDGSAFPPREYERLAHRDATDRQDVAECRSCLPAGRP